MIIEMVTGLAFIMVFIMLLIAIQMYKLVPALNVLYTNVVRGMGVYLLYGFTLGAIVTLGISAMAITSWQTQILPVLYELFLAFQGKNWSMTHVFK